MKGYFQTWQYVVKLPKFLQRPIKYLCGLRGHEWSKTEKGYCGGDNVDVWCRWCNFHCRVPLIESPHYKRVVGMFNDWRNKK